MNDQTAAIDLFSMDNVPEALLDRLPRKGRNELVADNILELLPEIAKLGGFAKATRAMLSIAYFNKHQVELPVGTVQSTLKALQVKGFVKAFTQEGAGKHNLYAITSAGAEAMQLEVDEQYLAPTDGGEASEDDSADA